MGAGSWLLHYEVEAEAEEAGVEVPPHLTLRAVWDARRPPPAPDSAPSAEAGATLQIARARAYCEGLF